MHSRGPAFRNLSKFSGLAQYQETLKSGYRLLPFKFTPLNTQEYVITNQAGEFLVLDRASLYAFANHELSWESEFYNTLKSKHFLIDDDSDVALDLLALKVRTKYVGVSDFVFEVGL